MNAATRPRWAGSAMGGRLAGAMALLVLLVAGCGREQLPPLEQARNDFEHGRFDAAIVATDKGLGETKQPSETAELLALKGRCYWEQAALADRPDEQTALLQKARETLSASIEAADNAEARHVRAMVHEILGESELAMADKNVARELDVSYRSAWVNERPQELLLQSPEPQQSTAEAAETVEDTGDSLAPSDTPSYASDEDRTGSPVSRDGDVAWSANATPSTSDRGLGGAGQAAGTARGSSERPSERSSERPSERSSERPGRSTAGLPLGLFGDRTLPNAAEETNAEREESEENDEDAEPAPEDQQEPESGDREPAPPKPPTWTGQPFGAPSVWGTAPATPYVPTTGLVGPDLGAAPQATPGEAAQYGGPPTTGITGPPGLIGPPAAQPSVPSVPTTGIGAAPLNPTMPSGIPSPFLPKMPQNNFSAMPRVPYTGALPPQFQPKGVAPAIGPQPPINGPHYSPLRPSPLTVPGGPATSLAPGLPGSLAPPRQPPAVKPTTPPKTPVPAK